MKNTGMKSILIIILILLSSSFYLFACRNDTLILEGRFYQDGEFINIKISDGRIASIEHISGKNDGPKLYIAPGFVDIQINGYMGFDFSDPDLKTEQLRKVTMELWKVGVTTFLPTVITNSHEALNRSFSILSQVFKDPVLSKSIPGFHLEGPYISPVQGFRGAHLEKYIRPPDWNEFMVYQKASGNGIKFITVAPEMEGAIEFIRKCVANGIVVALGHHNGSAEIIKSAADAGATMSTHLGNGCANMIDRHNNPLWPQLAEDRLTPTIIADGYHLNKAEIQTFYKVKGPLNTVLVSDALDLAGLPPGEYIRGERKVLLTPYVVKFPAENVLAGAASPIKEGVSNMMLYTQCSLKDAIQMASSNPARLLGLENIGEISQGKRADLIIFSIENDRIVIQKTIVAGEIVYSKE